MSPATTHRAGSGPRAPALPVLLLSLAVGVTAWSVSSAGDPGVAAAPVPTQVEQAAVGTDEAPAEEQAPDPVSVRVGSVDIEADTLPLGLRDDGALEVPEDPHVAGWWTGGANPGERGPAVIVAHVDSYEGPGAFYGLEEVEVGERVSVDREDGTSVHFLVERVERHEKDQFPTAAVYGDTDAPSLRLVTCAGEFDPEARSYADNVVVFLELEGWSTP